MNHFFFACYLRSNFVGKLLKLLRMQSFLMMTSIVLVGLQQGTAFSEAKTKISHCFRLNYIVLRFHNILTSAY